MACLVIINRIAVKLINLSLFVFFCVLGFSGFVKSNELVQVKRGTGELLYSGHLGTRKNCLDY